MNLMDLERGLLDQRTKGIPGGAAPFPIGEIGSKRWNVLREDLPLPVAVLKASSLDHNSRWMRRFLELSGAAVAPHGKTTMSPQLFQRQLDDGAWGITVANASQLQVARAYGVQRVLLANQLIGQAAIRYVLDELERDPTFDFYCLVDSVEGVELLAREARRRRAPGGRPIQVLVEGGFGGGRTGCRALSTALTVARAVRDAAPHVALRGVEGYEGIISGTSSAETTTRVRAFLDFLVDIAIDCAKEGLFAPGPVILSAGGSSYFDLVAERFAGQGLGQQSQVVIRSGCYLSHDSGMYDEAFRQLRHRSPGAAGLGEGLRPAIEVWSYLQSRPEPGRALLNMGKRDCSYDAGFPVPKAWYRPGGRGGPEPLAGHAITGLNDQHAYLAVPEGSPLAVGDMVACGISHPCTLFDKWQVLFVVNEEYDVVSAVRTFF